MVGLQLAIMATGNYCFFNLLTITLCLLVFDDAFWPQAWKEKLGMGVSGELKQGEAHRSPDWRWPVWILAPVAGAILVLSTMQMFRPFYLGVWWLQPIVQVQRWVAPFRIVNSYGLFAVMTTWRPEIIMEGSPDGVNWQAYEFKYKPGDLARRPLFNIPHQPRLDWQMWFAALADYRDQAWFGHFCMRLLQGSPQVLALLKKNPFPNRPPRYLRAVVYHYHFTGLATKRSENRWWSRAAQGLYCPIISLKSIRPE